MRISLHQHADQNANEPHFAVVHKLEHPSNNGISDCLRQAIYRRKLPLHGIALTFYGDFYALNIF
ncbi:MAG: hypothetical protein LBJ95_04365 [Oscillospiraceae bacterium]|jgi:hypothetical protein|nr:hypothetical protein [Oscillospiraceae bacterium]